MYKKNRLETLSIPVIEGVEALYNKVKQCSSPKHEHFAKLLPVVLEIFDFSITEISLRNAICYYILINCFPFL